jgi:hypothetical protein
MTAAAIEDAARVRAVGEMTGSAAKSAESVGHGMLENVWLPTAVLGERTRHVQTSDGQQARQDLAVFETPHPEGGQRIGELLRRRRHSARAPIERVVHLRPLHRFSGRIDSRENFCEQVRVVGFDQV